MFLITFASARDYNNAIGFRGGLYNGLTGISALERMLVFGEAAIRLDQEHILALMVYWDWNITLRSFRSI
ncbi:MAG: hypothetical protein A2V64_08325 [Bacteroidetes bacterium RBG_13_43_22]|nr:MAG: hypothetical protein A2V64_08325 [Bacteroidetes bacterium RBG_13_43_22]